MCHVKIVYVKFCTMFLFGHAHYLKGYDGDPFSKREKMNTYVFDVKSRKGIIDININLKINHVLLKPP